MRISLFLVADVCTVVAARRSSSIRGYKRVLLVHIHFVNTRTDVKRNENMDRRPNGQQKYCEITIDWTCVYTRWRASVDATQQRIEVGWKMQSLRKEGYDTVVTPIKKRCCLLQVFPRKRGTIPMVVQSYGSYIRRRQWAIVRSHHLCNLIIYFVDVLRDWSASLNYAQQEQSRRPA